MKKIITVLGLMFCSVCYGQDTTVRFESKIVGEGYNNILAVTDTGKIVYDTVRVIMMVSDTSGTSGMPLLYHVKGFAVYKKRVYTNRVVIRIEDDYEREFYKYLNLDKGLMVWISKSY